MGHEHRRHHRHRHYEPYPSERYDPDMGGPYRRPLHSYREEDLHRAERDRYRSMERDSDRYEDLDYDRDASAEFDREYYSEYYGPAGRDWRSRPYRRRHWDLEQDRGRYGPTFRSPHPDLDREYNRYGDRQPWDRYEETERGPHFGKGPKGYQRSSERIKEDVTLALTQNGAVNAFDIDIKVDGGEVTLEGTVPTRYMKRISEYIAESVAGVTDVHNRLKVAPHEPRESDWQPAQ